MWGRFCHRYLNSIVGNHPLCKQNTEPFELIHNLVEKKKLLYSSAKKFGSKSQKSVGEGFDSQKFQMLFEQNIASNVTRNAL